MEKKTMGSFLAALRRANGMTQKELAERMFGKNGYCAMLSFIVPEDLEKTICSPIVQLRMLPLKQTA